MNGPEFSQSNNRQQSFNNEYYLASNKADLAKYDCPDLIFPLEGNQCPGPNWRYGHISCQRGTILSLATTVVSWGKRRGVYFPRTCRDCAHLYANIQTWIRTTRANDQGNSICGWSISCHNMVEDMRAQCAMHYRKLFSDHNSPVL